MCLFKIQVNQWHRLLAYRIGGIVMEHYSRLLPGGDWVPNPRRVSGSAIGRGSKTGRRVRLSPAIDRVVRLVLRRRGGSRGRSGGTGGRWSTGRSGCPGGGWRAGCPGGARHTRHGRAGGNLGAALRAYGGPCGAGCPALGTRCIKRNCCWSEAHILLLAFSVCRLPVMLGDGLGPRNVRKDVFVRYGIPRWVVGGRLMRFTLGI